VLVRAVALGAFVALVACGDDGADPSSAAPAAVAASPSPTTGDATVRVLVRREATDLLGVGGDGKGPLYVALFTANRAQDPEAERIASTVVPDADLTGGRVVEAVLEDVPTREAPYHVSVFLDDDLGADPTSPSPGRGDSIGMADLTERTVPTLVVDRPGEVEMALPLTFVLPFDP
jgi:hypothetical protein